MSQHPESNTEQTSNRQQILSSLVIALLGVAAIWYAWLRFTSLATRTEIGWYEWIQPSMMVLFGVLSFWAALLSLLLRPDALFYFKLGLSIIPLILFVNLIILLFRVIAGILQGNAAFLLGSLTNIKDQKVK